MKLCRFLSKREVLAIHLEQIREHGGATGIRDEGLLESALARPENLASYGEPHLFDLAATYSFGIAKNHPFVDGNKRTAFMAAYTFLGLNGQQLIATEVDAALVYWRLAAGEVSESELAAWFRLNSEAR